MHDSRRVIRSGRRATIVALSLAAFVGAPKAAHAQFLRRLYVEVDGTVGSMLSSPQSTEYGLGFGVMGRAGLRVGGPIGVHLQAGYHRWGASDTSLLGAGSLTVVGAGVRFMPQVSRSIGGPIVDLEGGVALTGADTLTRFHAGLGLGWLFPIGEYFSLGPVVRGGAVFGSSADQAVSRGTAMYWEAGIAIAFPSGREAPPPDDTDGDGIVDPQDRCPTQAENRNGFEDTDGCPDDPDTDNDGVRDSTDRCVSEAEDRDGFQDEDGCPDPDNDADGVPDSSDRCPSEAEDRDSFQDEDGCPDPDNDADGIADAADRCPIVAETRNNFEDEDGCPDTAPPTAVVVESRITINQRVQFEYNRAVLLPASNAILDVVVSTLRDHPEIRRLRVEGHADDQGTPAHNMDLSRNRARAVMRYLQQHGVARNRLESEGYGSTRPVVQGETEEAHAANRRVDFVIVDPAGGPAAAATPAPSAPAAPEEPAPGGRRHRRHRRH